MSRIFETPGHAITKIVSIGIQVRHRLTTHGFTMNVTKEPLARFDQLVPVNLQT